MNHNIKEHVIIFAKLSLYVFLTFRHQYDKLQPISILNCDKEPKKSVFLSLFNDTIYSNFAGNHLGNPVHTESSIVIVHGLT